jgi:hypothetical protein
MHPCTDIANIIALGIGIIIQIQQDTSGSGTTARDRRWEQLTPEAYFGGTIAQNGTSYTSIDAPTLARRDGDDGADVAHYVVARSVTFPNATVYPTDMHYKQYVNGSGYIHVIHQVPGFKSARYLSKRDEYGGPGFKYNFRSYVWDSEIGNADPNT